MFRGRRRGRNWVARRAYPACSSAATAHAHDSTNPASRLPATRSVSSPPSRPFERLPRREAACQRVVEAHGGLSPFPAQEDRLSVDLGEEVDETHVGVLDLAAERL